jgi:carbamate kinase
MVAAGWNVVITHGSGPQVGFILRRSEIALGEVPPVPMDYAAADLQGAIGYMFQRALRNEFKRRGLQRSAIAVVTQVLVDRNDPAFADPAKPIGSHMDEPTARRRATELGWIVREDAGRGWRRVVPSPLPQGIVEIDEIEHLVTAGHVVIACGGGGIPVCQGDDGDLHGVEAVIDKDLASSMLARELNADLLVISTSVARVAINFGRPDQRWLERLTRAEAEAYLAEGHFAEGSMAPKIRAIIAYLERPGRRGLITDPPNIGRALDGQAGTVLTFTDVSG